MYLVIEVGNREVILTEENSCVYKFRNNRYVDHVFVEAISIVMYIFDCPQLLDALENAGATTITADDPSDLDLDAYTRYEADRLDDELRLLR